MRSLTLACVLLVAGSAGAGNTDSFFLSNGAALSGGAIAAITHDGGAVWYNPAGLGAASRDTLDLSGSAFVLRLRDMPGAIRTILPSGEHSADLGSKEFLSVPASLVFVRRFGVDVSGGLGVFVPSQDRSDLGDTLRVEDVPFGGQVGGYAQRLLIDQDNNETHGVIAVGWRLSEQWRLGLAIHVVHVEAHAFAQAVVDVQLEGQTAASNVLELAGEVGGIGTMATLGVQWSPTPQWHLGLVVRSPLFVIHRYGDLTSVAMSASGVGERAGQISTAFSDEDLGETGFVMSSPARFVLAAGYEFSRGHIALEAELRPGLFDEDREIDERLVWNVRAGGRYAVNDTWELGGGIFTDRSNRPPPVDLGQPRVDFYGLSIGAELRTPHVIRGREGLPPLVFGTTVAVRYAVGVGEFAGLTIDYVNGDGAATPTLNDAIFHEVGLHIGSALYF